MDLFKNIKNSYIFAINGGKVLGLDYDEGKRGNESLYDFCKSLINGSQYSAEKKEKMRNQLLILKETMDEQIKNLYCR